MKKAILYVRAEGVSQRAKEYERGKALERAFRDNYTFDEIIEVESAEAIMPCVLSSQIKAVYVYDPARLGRNDGEARRTRAFLSENNVKLVAVK